MLELFNIRSGAVVDGTCGHETDEALELPVQGLAEPSAHVTVDGVAAVRGGRKFMGVARLTRRVNDIVIHASSQEGETTQVITVVWDKKAYRRYGFSIDDNSFFLTDIARERPKSLFDHFYLKGLRDIHRKYGTCFILNCFYRNDHAGFTMDKFPDCYKSEFEENSPWLRLAFHAYSEFPNRPYQHANAKKLAEDYDLIASEIVRFAGERTLIAPTNIHWGMQPPETQQVLHDRGMRVQTGSFILEGHEDQDGRPSRVCDVSLYCDRDVCEYVVSHLAFYDRIHDMFLCPDALICNLTPLERIEPEIDRVLLKNPFYRTAIGLLTHEQYTYPYYANYLPDHLQRIERACKCVTEAGYRPVFLTHGLLGNMAWEQA